MQFAFKYVEDIDMNIHFWIEYNSINSSVSWYFRKIEQNNTYFICQYSFNSRLKNKMREEESTIFSIITYRYRGALLSTVGVYFIRQFRSVPCFSYAHDVPN